MELANQIISLGSVSGFFLYCFRYWDNCNQRWDIGHGGFWYDFKTRFSTLAVSGRKHALFLCCIHLVCCAVVLLMPYGSIFWHIMILSFSVHCLLCSCYCTLMTCTLAFDANTYALYGDATLSIILPNQTNRNIVLCVLCVTVLQSNHFYLLYHNQIHTEPKTWNYLHWKNLNMNWKGAMLFWQAYTIVVRRRVTTQIKHEQLSVHKKHWYNS